MRLAGLGRVFGLAWLVVSVVDAGHATGAENVLMLDEAVALALRKNEGLVEDRGINLER